MLIIEGKKITVEQDCTGVFVPDKITPIDEAKQQVITLADGRTIRPSMVVEGKFQQHSVENANKRKYSEKLWSRQCSESSPSMGRVKERAMFGMVEHPSDGVTDLNKCSHLVTGLKLQKDGIVWGRAEIFDTPEGKRMQEYFSKGARIGVSSRGKGTVGKDGWVDEESYELETFDFVYNPSVAGAYPKPANVTSQNNHTESVESTTEFNDTPHLEEITMDLVARFQEMESTANAMLNQDIEGLQAYQLRELANRLLTCCVEVGTLGGKEAALAAPAAALAKKLTDKRTEVTGTLPEKKPAKKADDDAADADDDDDDDADDDKDDGEDDGEGDGEGAKKSKKGKKKSESLKGRLTKLFQSDESEKDDEEEEEVEEEGDGEGCKAGEGDGEGDGEGAKKKSKKFVVPKALARFASTGKKFVKRHGEAIAKSQDLSNLLTEFSELYKRAVEDYNEKEAAVELSAAMIAQFDAKVEETVAELSDDGLVEALEQTEAQRDSALALLQNVTSDVEPVSDAVESVIEEYPVLTECRDILAQSKTANAVRASALKLLKVAGEKVIDESVRKRLPLDESYASDEDVGADSKHVLPETASKGAKLIHAMSESATGVDREDKIAPVRMEVPGVGMMELVNNDKEEEDEEEDEEDADEKE